MPPANPPAILGWIKDRLQHPATRGLDVDDPRTTALRRQIVRDKPLLRAVYEDWYGALAAALPPPPGRVVELGAGGGFLDRHIDGVVRSEVFWCPWVDATLDAQSLPFPAASLRGVVMTNVLHHLADPSGFFAEAARCVRPGGVVAMVEPWNSTWSRWVYRRLHHEPFEPGAPEWTADPQGPLSGGNGALPWVLFARDRARFARQHPEWRVNTVSPRMPLRYLVSGGVSLRSLAPAASAPLWRGAEWLLRPLGRWAAMFALIVLERRAE